MVLTVVTPLTHIDSELTRLSDIVTRELVGCFAGESHPRVLLFHPSVWIHSQRLYDCCTRNEICKGNDSMSGETAQSVDLGSAIS